MFAVAFAAMALLVAYSPDVWGTEKPMDMAFVNASNASTSFPPHDPWMAGEDLNYYYLGHLAMAIVIKVVGAAPDVGYNLAFALLAALCGDRRVHARAARCGRPRGRGWPASAAARWRSASRRSSCASCSATSRACASGSTRPTRPATTTGSRRRAWSRGRSTSSRGSRSCSATCTRTCSRCRSPSLALAFALQVALAGPRGDAVLRGVAEALAAGLAVGALYAVNSWSYP